MEPAMRNFIIIIAIDILIFFTSGYIWCKKRAKIISFIHTGFAELRLKYRKRQKEEAQLADHFDQIDQVEVRKPYLFNSNAAHALDKSSPRNGDCGLSERGSEHNIYVGHRKAATGMLPDLQSQKNIKDRQSWWYHLLHGNEGMIRNNEAVLYLRFMKSMCMMLLLCSAVAVVTNGIILTHLTLNNKPYFLTTYSLEDLLKCKVTIWTLYATTWIYSIIVYVYILKFRNKVNKGKQITVMLRPQLHTIMITGFEKTVTDPTLIYKYFEKYFPEHILSVHLVFNHSKRIQLEEELEATKAQLSLCRDMTIVVPPKPKAKEHEVQAVVTPKRDKNNNAKQTPLRNTASHRRSQSCGTLHIRDRVKMLEAKNKLPRRSASSRNLRVTPKNENKETQKTVETTAAKKNNSITHIFKKLKRPSQLTNREHTYEEVDSRFASLLKKVKELKVLIDQEVKRKHTTSARICFVSFADSNLVLHILKDRNILEEMPTWRICPAPHPRDIIWKNLHIRRFNVFLRIVFYNLMLIVFYILITWVLSHLNLLQTVKSSEEAMPGEEEMATVNINDISERSIWSAVMPPIVMATLNTCVHPTLINNVSTRMGFWMQTTYQKYLLFGHVFYLVISTILIPLLASMIAFWKIFDGAFDSLSIDLGKVLVSTTWRFSTIYVLNATFLGSSNQLLQLSQICIRALGIYFFKYDFGVQNFDFGYWYAFHLSILTLVMLFSVFIPYLPLLGTLYFGIRYCVDRHNIAYDVLQLPLDSTGKISASAVKSMLLCISLTQFAMSGVFLNCQDVLPPICITLLYIASVATWLLMYESNADAMVEATESLHNLKLKPLNKVMMDTIKICYMHPCDSKDLIDGKNK